MCTKCLREKVFPDTMMKEEVAYMVVIKDSTPEEQVGACYLGGGSCGPDSDDHDGSCKN